MHKDEVAKLFEPTYKKYSSYRSNGLISFCIYGPHDLYNLGAYENIAEAKEYFPEWNLRFYVAEDCPIVSRLLEEDVDVFVMPKPEGVLGTFWRLEPISDKEYEFVLIRDTDQRLNDKDANAVEAWVRSYADCHRMFEDPSQTHVPLMACSIGFRTGVIGNMKEEMVDWLCEKKGMEITHWANVTSGREDFPRLLYGSEQLFLAERIWPLYRDSCLTHGCNGVEFPNWRKPLKWGDPFMFRRITPNTGNKEVFGARPQYAYDTESH